MARYTGNHCPVCEQEFTDNDDIVVCPDCGTPAGMMAGPAYAAPRKRGGPLTILLIMAVAFLALTAGIIVLKKLGF